MSTFIRWLVAMVLRRRSKRASSAELWELQAMDFSVTWYDPVSRKSIHEVLPRRMSPPKAPK